MGKKKFRRKKLVNKRLQGQLMLKMVLHWIGYNGVVIFMSVASLMFVYCIAMVSETPERTMKEEFFQFFSSHKPMLLAMCVLLPFIVWDMLKTSHRVAGPVYKFRTELDHYVSTGEMRKVKLRDGDFLDEFEVSWNQAVDRFNSEAKADCATILDEVQGEQPTATNVESPTMVG